MLEKNGIEFKLVQPLSYLLAGKVHFNLTTYSMVNAFLVYKGAKEMDSFLSDTALQTSISTIAAGSGLVTERLLQKLSIAGGLPTMLIVTSASMVTRAIITRVINRNDYVQWLADENQNMQKLIDTLN